VQCQFSYIDSAKSAQTYVPAYITYFVKLSHFLPESERQPVLPCKNVVKKSCIITQHFGLLQHLLKCRYFILSYFGIIWSSYMLKNLFRPPSPEAVRLEMIAETARQLLHAEGRLCQAQADRDTYDRLLTHLKSLNFQGLSAPALSIDSELTAGRHPAAGN
jgi:hypothetical protein